MNYPQKILGIIPARFASSRFPGKPLADIAGKSMIHRVYRQAMKANLLSNVVIATDDERIFSHVMAFGGNVVMTSQRHFTGTERCAEVIRMKAFSSNDVIINIQGDEPLIDPDQINLLASLFINANPEIATLVRPLTNGDDLQNQGIVKVAIGKNQQALYFSRSPIPFVRAHPFEEWTQNHQFFQHIGIYGYNREALLKISRLDATPNEKAESLEQLRWLDNGIPILTALSDHLSYSIDTPDDLQRILQIINPKSEI
ncbi:MAG: 3-deoxy-manno-octulosonate cytidylyltransferase [Bacteroidales bacterium]